MRICSPRFSSASRRRSARRLRSRSDHLVKAELLADVSSVKPGEPFTVGVLLKMKPHWHVYWKNPGDSRHADLS